MSSLPGNVNKRDRSVLSHELRQEVGRVLNEAPVIFVAEYDGQGETR